MLKKSIKKVFNSLGYELSNLESFRQNEIKRTELFISFNKLLNILSHSGIVNAVPEVKKILKYPTDKFIKSKSQLFQDIIVLSILNGKRDGFFVEFGATDGITFSNTFLLEKEYNWNGILAEPGKIWQERLERNRDCFIDSRCLWSNSDEVLKFYETEYPELSTIGQYAEADSFSKQRLAREEYEVRTISLNDLLNYYNAPNSIDYMSVDTEGSEYKILSSFDFSKYNVSIITVEHNFTKQRENILKLLTENGYRRILESISSFDDWYIKQDLIL